MLNAGKKNVIGIKVDAVDYEAAEDLIFKAAGDKLKEKYAPTPAPAPAPAPPAAPVNITITHEYNTDTEGIDPIE